MKKKLFCMLFCAIFSNSLCMEQQGFAFSLTDDDIRDLYDDLKTDESHNIFQVFKAQLLSLSGMSGLPGARALEKKLDRDYEELQQMVAVMFHRQGQQTPPMEFYEAAWKMATEVNHMVEACVVSALADQLGKLK